jgi:hypothetical protein
MSEAIPFDTYRFVKRLVETGMSEATAQALADEQANLLNSNLATKTDLAETRADLLKWMIGLMVAQTGLIASVITFTQ